jgi:hypothetical protein
MYSVGLRVRWSGVRVSVGARNLSPHHHVQTGSGAHPASYSMGTRDSFPGSKAAGAWSWSLTPIFPRSRMRGDIPLLPQYAFMGWCSVKKSTGIPLPLPFYLTADCQSINQAVRQWCSLSPTYMNEITIHSNQINTNGTRWMTQYAMHSSLQLLCTTLQNSLEWKYLH